MSNWTPKEIDQLFQDGSEKYEFEYNEAAWGKMKVLLDDRDQQRKHLLWWSIGILLGILLMGGVYFFRPVPQEKQAPKKIETITLKETKQLSINDDFEKTATKENLTSIKDAVPIPNSAKTLTDQSIQKESASFDNTATKTIQPKEKYAVPANQTNQTAITIVNPKTVLPTPNAYHLASASEVTLTGQRINNLSTDSISKQGVQNVAKINNTLKIAPIKRVPSVKVVALPTLSNSIALFNEPILLDTAFLKQQEARKPNQEKVNNNHFVIGVLLGRELSYAGIGLCDPNWKAGLSLAYRFGEKHSLKIEGSYVKKEYAANGDQYLAPQNFWENGIVPQTALGTCNIIEASITESYFFKGHAKRGFYIEAGLSSYFMLREQYNYNFDPANQNLRSAWGTRNENQHWFGIGEVAAGYNLPLSNNTSLQIAPYAHIPFTGIGHGQIKFFSSGIQIRYNFHLN